MLTSPIFLTAVSNNRFLAKSASSFRCRKPQAIFSEAQLFSARHFSDRARDARSFPAQRNDRPRSAGGERLTTPRVWKSQARASPSRALSFLAKRGISIPGAPRHSATSSSRTLVFFVVKVFRNEARLTNPARNRG